MIILDSTTRSLEVVLSGVITTNQLPIVATYVDITSSPDTYIPKANTTQTNNITAVTVVAAPSASTQRQVKFLSIRNADTVSATVTIRYNDNSTLREIVKISLSINDVLVYTDGDGFRVVDGSGNTKTSLSMIPGGSDGEIQYNNSGVLGGDSGLAFNDVTGIVTIAGGLKTPLIFPISDSISAVKITKADGVTNLFNIDSINSRIGFGTAAPSFRYHFYDVSGVGNGVIYSESAGLSQYIARSTTHTDRELRFQIFSDGITYFGPMSLGGTVNANLVIRASAASGTNTGEIRFNTGSSQKAVITNGGNWGVGIAAPITTGHYLLNNTTSAAVDNVVTIGHNRSNGAAAAGFGSGLIFTLETSTTDDQSAGRLTYEWVVATHASRTARSKWTVYDTAEREGLRIEASGSVVMIGAYGVTAVARPSALTQTYSTADRTHASRTASTLTDNSAGTANTTIEALPDPTDTPLTADALRDDIVANLLPALRNNFADLAAQINALKADSDDTAQFINSAVDDLQSEGWLQ